MVHGTRHLGPPLRVGGIVVGLALFAQVHVDWRIVPGERVGPITATTSLAQLRTWFPAAEVQAAEVGLGEGETVPGTVLFPGDPVRRLEILWTDSTMTAPAEIRINGDSSAWRTPEGIGLGTSLGAIERANGRAFRLLGFGWDYGGTVMDCGGGRLTWMGCVDPADRFGTVRGRVVVLRLDVRRPVDDLPAYRQVTGDKEFSSGHPAMQKLDPRVYQIVVLFNDR